VHVRHYPALAGGEKPKATILGAHFS
jgi:hypothetical protein